MNKKTTALLNELGYSKYDNIELPEALNVRKDRIRQMVNNSLDSVPQERRRHMRQKQLKIAVILAAALLLTTATVWAASNLGLLSWFFEGDMSTLEEHVKTPRDSVSDGNFTLTLEEVLPLESTLLFIYSVEGHGEEAVNEIMNPLFDGSVTVNGPSDADVKFFLTYEREIETRRTATKRYFACTIQGVDNPEGLPVYVSLDIMADEKKFIEIPMDVTVEVRELILPMPDGEDTVVCLSPADISVERNAVNGFEEIYHYMDLFFRMEDGSIRTFNELFQYQGGSNVRRGDDEDRPLRLKHSAKTRDILELSSLKGIIVGNLEYNLSDPSQATEVQVPESLRPFTVELALHPDPLYENSLFMFPAEELMKKLGGEIAFDETGQNAIMQYRGETLEIRDGNYYKNGQLYGTDRYPAVMTEGGVLTVDRGVFIQCFHILDYPSYEGEKGRYLIIP